MPYLRKASDNAFGLIPYDQVLRMIQYRTDASAEKIWAGDLIKLSSDGRVDPIDAVTDNRILGVAAQTVASGSATTVMVYDHPDQLFVIQDDSDTTNVAETNVGNHASPINLTGSDTTDRSLTELDSSTAAASAAAAGDLMLRIVRLHPVEDESYASAAGSPRKWIVQINPFFHHYASNTAI